MFIETRLRRAYFRIMTEDAAKQLAFAKAKLATKRDAIARRSNQIPEDVNSKKMFNSPLWFTEPLMGKKSVPEPFDPIPIPGEAPITQWVPSTVEIINLDQIVNQMSHLQPVSTPHFIATQIPVVGVFGQRLTELKVRAKFSSNWFITTREAQNIGLLLKSGQRPHAVTRMYLQKLYHVSQLSNAEEIVSIPFSMRGINLAYIPEICREVTFREATGQLGPHLFVSKKNLLSPATSMMRLTPTAREVQVQSSYARGMTANEADGDGTPRSLITKTQTTHYYNISDVRFPETFALPNTVTDFEARHPGVPVDGMSGEQLVVDALVNLPNIQRCVWFSAAQLLNLGARCGVNAVPIIVTQQQEYSSVHSWYHVNDFEDPRAMLALVGSV